MTDILHSDCRYGWALLTRQTSHQNDLFSRSSTLLSDDHCWMGDYKTISDRRHCPFHIVLPSTFRVSAVCNRLIVRRFSWALERRTNIGRRLRVAIGRSAKMGQGQTASLVGLIYGHRSAADGITWCQAPKVRLTRHVKDHDHLRFLPELWL